MENKDIIKKLIEEEEIRLKSYKGYPDFCGADRYITPKEVEEHMIKKEKYWSIRRLAEYFESDKLNSRRISKDIPEWKDIIKDLIIKELDRYEEYNNGTFTPIFCFETNCYDKTSEEYQRLMMMKEKLEDVKKPSRRSRISIFPKRPSISI